MNDSEQIPLVEDENRKRGRRFRLKIKRNYAARQDALASIRPLPRGGFTARIGGKIRGETVTFMSRRAAEAVINQYYNSVMMNWLDAQKISRA